MAGPEQVTALKKLLDDYAQQRRLGGDKAALDRLADRNRTEFYRLLQKHELTPGHFQSQAPERSVSPTGDGSN